MATIVSINVGRPQTVSHEGRAVETAIYKQPVEGRVRVGKLNIAGDAQADLIGHGGEQRAVLVYQLDSYRYWADHLKRDAFPYGTFGENITVDGLSDEEVCIGDRFQAGSAVFEVSQPRVTCFKVGMKLAHREMPALLVAHRRPGFYLRVIEEGEIGAGDALIPIGQDPERLSVATVDALLYSSDHDRDRLARALRIQALSPGWRQSFEELLAAADQGVAHGNAALGRARRPPAWSGYRELKVVASHLESAGIRSFELAAADGSALPQPLPGQYVGIRVHPAAGAAAAIRSYSLCGDPRAPTYRIAVKNEHGVVSGFLHAALDVGVSIAVSAPRGDFLLEREASPAILLSAGVGVTPLLAMLHAAASAGGSGEQLWWVHSARNGREHAFAREVDRLLDGVEAARRVVFYSRPDPLDQVGRDYDLPGRLDVDRLLAMGLPIHGRFYLCGPIGYLAEARAALVRIGVPAEHIHEEAFGPVGSSAGVPPHAPEGEAGDGPPVVFAKSALTVPWQPRFASLLELAEACSVPVGWSCRSGICHRCETGLVAGEVSYDPQPFDPPGDGSVLLCCATPRGEVTLDL